MASIAMMVGGAIVNALAFSGSNFLFSTMGESNAKEIEEERKQHNKALEQLEIAQSQWTRKRMQRLDLINDGLRKQNHSIQTFKNVEFAMHEYFHVYGKTLDPIGTLTQFYPPSEGQKGCEISVIGLGLSAVAIFSYAMSHEMATETRLTHI